MAQEHHMYDDKLGYLGKIKVVQGKTFKQGDIDGSVQRLHSARLPQGMRNLSRTQLYGALEEHYAVGCSHEHDCCGCYFGGIYNIYTNGRYISFRTNYQRNV